MKTKNYDTIGFIRASQYRMEILKMLSEDMKLPSEIAYDLKIRVQKKIVKNNQSHKKQEKKKI